MKIAISIGDLNGIGVEIALKAHSEISKLCEPIYCVSGDMLSQAARKLKLDIPRDMVLKETDESFEITAGVPCAKAGEASYESFRAAVWMAKEGEASGVVTLPINKKAWQMAHRPYMGHTDALRAFFEQDAVMMLGCEKMFVALFTEHIALKEVPKLIRCKKVKSFLLTVYECTKAESIAVLGLNPHGGEDGEIGSEDKKIAKAISKANEMVGRPIFAGPFAPDTAFTPAMRQKYSYFAAMYHDQGLAALKALYFDESINITLGLPIVRTSVDHGTAFDIAYKNGNPSTISFINAVKEVARLIKIRQKCA